MVLSPRNAVKHPHHAPQLFGGDVCPFALSLSKGRSWFDRLTTNGWVPSTLNGCILYTLNSYHAPGNASIELTHHPRSGGV